LEATVVPALFNATGNHLAQFAGILRTLRVNHECRPIEATQERGSWIMKRSGGIGGGTSR
jgi:hypothetical protein